MPMNQEGEGRLWLRDICEQDNDRGQNDSSKSKQRTETQPNVKAEEPTEKEVVRTPTLYKEKSSVKEIY